MTLESSRPARERRQARHCIWRRADTGPPDAVALRFVADLEPVRLTPFTAQSRRGIATFVFLATFGQLKRIGPSHDNADSSALFLRPLRLGGHLK